MENGRLAIGMTTKKLPAPPQEPYHNRNREPIKKEYRAKVTSHILRNHTPRLPMRYFGLPGEHYRTEWDLSDQWKHGINFVGVERNWGILEKSRAWMPGGPGRMFEEKMRNGRLLGIKTRKAKTVNFGCAQFLNLGRHFKMNRQHRHVFADRYKRWTAFWLDVCGNTTGEVMDCLLRVGQWSCKDAVVVPFAITFAIGRETHHKAILAHREGTALETRVELIKTILGSGKFREALVDESWQYKSAGRAPMGMALGRLLLK